MHEHTAKYYFCDIELRYAIPIYIYPLSQKNEYLNFLNCTLLWKAIRCFQSRLTFDENELK